MPDKILAAIFPAKNEDVIISKDLNTKIKLGLNMKLEHEMSRTKIKSPVYSFVLSSGFFPQANLG